MTSLFFALGFVCQTADAKINIFPKARYIPELSFYADNGQAYKLKDFKSDLLLFPRKKILKPMQNVMLFCKKLKLLIWKAMLTESLILLTVWGFL